LGSRVRKSEHVDIHLKYYRIFLNYLNSIPKNKIMKMKYKNIL